MRTNSIIISTVIIT